MVLMLSLSMVALFALTSCTQATTTTTAAETTAAGTTAAGETTAAETQPVAGAEELYIMCQPGNGIEILDTYAWGGYLAEKYWQALGANVKFEWTGPDDFNADKLIASLEATIAKKPTGILFWPIGYGEDKLLTDYFNSGGLIAGMNGAKGSYPVNFIIGTNNTLLGSKEAQGCIDALGTKFSVGIMANAQNGMGIERLNGINSVFSQNKDVTVLPLVPDVETKDAATANAAAFLSAHPDVNALIGTSSMDGAAWARAVQEAGIAPGKITIVGVDKDADTLDLIDSGYITFSISQNFPVESFYAIALLHFMKNRAVTISNDDATALGLNLPGVEECSTTLNKITKDNSKDYRDIKPPEGYTNAFGKF